ncbi:hypothetical protein ALC60_13166, partial [Trachymyrmex zeteki]
VNLSTVFIPQNIQNFSQLGDNFALPLNNRLNLTVDFIKCIESNIYKLPIEWISISNHSLPVLNNLASCSLHRTKEDRSLSQLAKDTRIFLRDMNDRVISTRADKSNVTIALDRQVYISKVNEMLQENTYKIIEKDLTRRIVTAYALLVNWKEEKYVSNSTHRSLLSNDGILPRAYALSKIKKKQDCPFRIIVSSINSTLYSLAVFFHSIVTTLYKPTFSSRYLNFCSQHLVSQKIGTIAGLIDREVLLSSPKFHFDNFCFIIKVLLENDYSLNFIFENISNRLKNIIMANNRNVVSGNSVNVVQPS